MTLASRDIGSAGSRSLPQTADLEQAAEGAVGDDAEVPPLAFPEVAAQFPIKRKRAYLNNASIGPMSEPVLGAVNAFLNDVRDNGRNNYPKWCRYSEEQIKARVARLIGARRS